MEEVTQGALALSHGGLLDGALPHGASTNGASSNGALYSTEIQLSHLPEQDETIRRARRNMRRDRRSVWPRRRLLIVGAGEEGHDLACELEKRFPHDYVVVGFADDAPMDVAQRNGWNLLGSRSEIAALLERHGIDKVMVADFPAEGNAAESAQVSAFSFSEELRKACSPRYRIIKRSADIVVSLLALVLGAPLAALAALAIKLTLPGPAFYRQERVGRGGRIFTVYKLRTMPVNAENETGPVLAQRSDLRTTPLGRLMRALHLDEWPQFYNVLRGEMSIIGPRPERAYFVERYCRHIPQYGQRHAILPGITGLAQVSGDNLTHVHVKLHYDLMYAYNQSFWLDVSILARTPLAILRNLISNDSD